MIVNYYLHNRGGWLEYEDEKWFDSTLLPFGQGFISLVTCISILVDLYIKWK